MRIYKGLIFTEDGDQKYLTGIDTTALLRFVQTGEWIAGGRSIGSYQLCDEDGEVLEEYSNLQFTRSRDNRFYLETVG